MPSYITSLLALATVGLAAHDCCSPLNKPPLVDNLGYLEDGFNRYLPVVGWSKDKWAPGTMPQLCKNIIGGKVIGNVNYNLDDIEIWNIKYNDCGDPWVFCHHKNSNVTIDTMALQFGRLPIQMRQWVRHVIDLPRDGGSAFAYDGTITFLRPVSNMLSTIIHETGHVLDANAYADKPLSVSDLWWNEYNQDPKVPDNYAASKMIENVAQNTVVATYNENVPGGYGSVEPNWQQIFHQYATIITQARNAGNGNSILTPGQSGQCTHRLPNSPPVSTSSKKRAAMPDVSLKSGVEELAIRAVEKLSKCSLTW